MTDPLHPTGETRAGRHVLDSPVDLPPAPVDARRPWRWTTGVIATAALFLAAFNAQAVGDWFDELTPSPVSEPLRTPVARWVTVTDPLGAPRTWLRARWTAAQGARFGHEQPGERGAAAGR